MITTNFGLKNWFNQNIKLDINQIKLSDRHWGCTLYGVGVIVLTRIFFIC